MNIMYYVFIGIVVIAVLFGIKDWILMFLGSLYENGAKFTILMVLFFILLFTPSVVKHFAPEYYGLSIWAFILYCVGLLIYRFWFSNTKHDDLEG